MHHFSRSDKHRTAFIFIFICSVSFIHSNGASSNVRLHIENFSKVKSESLIQHTYCQILQISSRSASCPFCLCTEKKKKQGKDLVFVHSLPFVNWREIKQTEPKNTPPANQQQGNQLNFDLFLCFCWLLSLLHILAHKEQSYTRMVMKQRWLWRGYPASLV